MKATRKRLRVIRSPAREQLAQRIAEHTALTTSLAKTRAAHDEAQEVVLKCHGAIAHAKEALAQAQRDEPARLAAKALGEGNALLSVADAADQLKRCENDLALARATKAALAERSEREETELTKAAHRIAEAVGGVIAEDDVGQALLKRAEGLRDELISVRCQLSFLLYDARAFDDETRHTVESFLQNRFIVDGFVRPDGVRTEPRAHPACERLREHVAALMKGDPEAVMPAV